MPLGLLIDRVANYLDGQIAALEVVGGRYPTHPADLPTATLSITEVERTAAGIGKVPVIHLDGALSVDTAIDLANPVLTFPNETVELLSADRLVLQVPHGPLVRADGTGDPPFDAADFQILLDATPVTLVSGVPGPGEANLDPATGSLTFGSALPSDQILNLTYFVGAWEVRAERLQGGLKVELFADDAAELDSLTTAVSEALRRQPALAGVEGLQNIMPTAWGPALPPNDDLARARSRALGYWFDFEHAQPLLQGGGGVIAVVHVDNFVDGALEPFDVALPAE